MERVSVLRLTVVLYLLFAAGNRVVDAAPLNAAAMKSKPDAWFKTEDAQKFIANLLSWQLPEGGWQKGYDANGPRPGTPPANVDHWTGVGTFDNGHTFTEIRFLAAVYKLTGRADLLDAFNRGLDFIFKSQYPNGGWPQRYPLPPAGDYGRDITLNDNAMYNVMLVLQDVIAGAEPFTFVDSARREAAKRAFDKGIDCLLRLQVVVNGTPTAWAQQFDAESLKPSKARSYELPSLTGDESAGVTTLLMSLDAPSPAVKRAVHHAAAWFEKSKILGIKTERREDKSLPRGFDVVVVEDPAAPPLWARFYEIDTNRPYFCGRDGVKKYSLAEIEAERRAGYAWLRPWGEKILKEYPKWCQRTGETPVFTVATSTQPSDSKR